MKKKSILFIHPFFPYPLESGGHQALFNGLLAVKDDYDIYIAYEAWEGDAYYKAEKDFLERIPNAHLFPLLHKQVKLSYKQRLINKLKSGFNSIFRSPIPNNENKTMCSLWLNTVSPMNAGCLNHIDNICTKYQFDIIQVEMPWMLSQVLALPEYAKKVYVHHELGFVRRKQEVSNMQVDAYTKACRSFADYNEIVQLNMYDTVITLSEIDRLKLIDKGVTTAIYSSFAVIDTQEKLDFKSSDGKRLVFMGPDTHYPNYVGLLWFLDNCWKKLKDFDANYRLDIIGKWTETNKIKIKEKYEDVEFLGYVDNLYETMRGAIMIVPITVGSGIRMKILEASSKGIPFVSTRVGAEGIPVENGIHCFLADDPDEFQNNIVQLQDTTLQQQFAEKAHKIVCEKYSIEALRKNRIEIYQCTLESQSS